MKKKLSILLLLITGLTLSSCDLIYPAVSAINKATRKKGSLAMGSSLVGLWKSNTTGDIIQIFSDDIISNKGVSWSLDLGVVHNPDYVGTNGVSYFKMGEEKFHIILNKGYVKLFNYVYVYNPDTDTTDLTYELQDAYAPTS